MVKPPRKPKKKPAPAASSGKLQPDKQYQGAIRKGRAPMYKQISDQLAAGY